MKLTGSEIENVFEGLQALQDYKFDISTGCIIADLMKEIRPKYIEIITGKDNIIKEYGDKNEEGKVILDDENKAHIAPEFTEEVQKKLSDLYDKVYSIDCKYLQVEKLDKVELPLKQITNLMPILDK